MLGLYKQCAIKTQMKIHPAVIACLRHSGTLEIDMDCLADRQELPVFRFLSKATDLTKITFWSSLTKLEDVDYMMKANNPAYSEYIKSSVRQFYLKINMEAQVEPSGPTSVRSRRQLSLDIWENARLMKAI